VFDTLLATKFHKPPLLSNLVSRKHLLHRLDEGLQQGSRLTLISTPAGYGKTTLLGEWIRASNLPVAWLSLDEGDNDPARFLSYLVSALRTIEPQIGEAALAKLQNSQSQIPVEALTSLVNELLDFPGWILILFDDYHTIHNQAIHDALTFLLEHAPPHVHVVIASRADPLLPIARLRGRGQVTELRQNDLQFSKAEAGQFLGLNTAIELTPADVAALTSRTEGWAAGLQMASISLQEQRDVPAFIQDFTGSNRYILDYLIEEVLYQQPAPVQNFMLYTSILEHLCASLCDAVIEGLVSLPAGSQPTLEAFEHANLFIIPLDDRRKWYRYHRLFADLLQQRLYQSQPDVLNLLHLRASEWYEDRGFMESAIEHALSSGVAQKSAELIERSAESTLMRSQVRTLLSWIEALPEDELLNWPALSIYYSWALLWNGAPLEAIQAHLELTAHREEHSIKTLPLQAFLAIYNSQVPQAAQLARQALEQLPEKDTLLRSLASFILASSYLAEGEADKGLQILEETARTSQRSGNVMIAVLVLCELGDESQKRGRLHQAMRLYRQALELGTDEGGQRLPVAGKALIGIGDVAREWNDYATAEKSLTEGITLVEQWSVLGAFEGYLNLIQVYDTQGEVRRGDEMLSRLRELAYQFDASEIDDYVVEMYAARRNVALGDLKAVEEWADNRAQIMRAPEGKEGKIRDILRTRLQKYENATLARLFIAEGRYSAAIALLDQVIVEAKKADRIFLMIDAEILRAIAFQAQDLRKESLAAFTHALTLAEPEGFMRIFLDHGENTKELLEYACQELEDPSILRYIDRLLHAYSPRISEHYPIPGHRRDEIIESLSDREIEVLQLLPSSLSSTEMAEELSISVNTLRSHLKNIYAKLGAHSRYEAIARARESNLL
jgi:LuxR family maltose regulon positive regulatory protein